MPETIATGITTLDEARYFAAMGATWIGFDADHLSIAEVQAMSSWVVGPQLFAEFSAVEEERIFELTNKTVLQGICIPASHAIPQWYGGTVISKQSLGLLNTLESDRKILLLQIDASEIPESALTVLRSLSNHTLWLETKAHIPALVKILTWIGVQGIVIRCVKNGGGEDNSFEKYDQIFDALSRFPTK